MTDARYVCITERLWGGVGPVGGGVGGGRRGRRVVCRFTLRSWRQNILFRLGVREPHTRHETSGLCLARLWRVAGAPREGDRPARGPARGPPGARGGRCPPCATKVAQHAGIPPVSLSPRAELQKLRSPEAGGPGRRVETTGSSVGVLETLECTVQRGGRGPGGCRETVRILCGITITQKCTQGPDDQYTLQNG